MKPERKYKCYECKRFFPRDELVAHRCGGCRMNRMQTLRGDPARGVTPWVPRGQKAWVRFDGLGSQGGVYFRTRKRPITEQEGEKRLKKLDKLPTWKDPK